MMLSPSHPLAITMWDFSWLERRWPGAGYEDWGRALDELAERGYDAVRIDAYPHFLATPGGAEKTWELLPCWHFLDWGAPCRTRVRVMPALTDFIALCRERKIKVGLSTWFRQDVDDVRIHIADARQHGDMWVRTLELIRDSGLLDAICYVDLCNEWPIAPWAPFFKFHSKDPDNGSTAESRAWMAAAIRVVRSAFPDVPYTFSCWPDTKDESLEWPELDFFEPHIWMAQQRDFYARVGYTYQKYDIAGLELVASKGEATYRANERYWQEGLIESIDRHAAFSRRQKRLLATTECWGVVDYRDWPLLDWGWVKELCELGTRRAAQTGRWWAIATSNFCGPQFHGMWRDVAWHQKLARAIRSSQVEKAGT